MPAMAPTPSFDPLLLDDDDAEPVETDPPAVTTAVWPGVRVMTETLAVPPAEFCSVTVETTVAELPAVNVLTVAGWVTTAVVPPAVVAVVAAMVAAVVAIVAAGLAQESHWAKLMFKGMLVPPQFVFNVL
jgi:hypothetical protein